jgi:hypothetical protein
VAFMPAAPTVGMPDTCKPSSEAACDAVRLLTARLCTAADNQAHAAVPQTRWEEGLAACGVIHRSPCAVL